MKEIFTGVYKENESLFTENSVPGSKVYGEKLVDKKGIEYREWDPHRSKPAAAIMKGMKTFPVDKNSKILYLGAASGTTTSHFSDILSKGFIYALEFSSKVFKGLMDLSRERKNISPLLLDARRPDKTSQFLGSADLIYQDLAQRDQSEILIRNTEKFLNKGDHAMIAIKARSISSSLPSNEVFEKEVEKISQHFEVLEKVELQPYERDHLFLVLKKK